MVIGSLPTFLRLKELPNKVNHVEFGPSLPQEVAVISESHPGSSLLSDSVARSMEIETCHPDAWEAGNIAVLHK